MNGFEEAFAAEVEDWRARGLGRSLEGRGAALDFTSNDTLGLARHPEVVRAACRAAEAAGVGGRASRLLGGGGPDVRGLEDTVARWLGAEAALLLPSGYQAGLTLLPALVGRGDVVVSDALDHASLIDGLRLSRAEVRIARHRDVEHVAALLAETRGARRRLIVTESIFSMDGDAAPLVELADLAAAEGAGLVVDEAHAIGVLGAEGRGGFDASGADPAALVARIVPAGKALGATGAFVAGSRALAELLVHRGRGFVFSTAVSPMLVGALGAAIEVVRRADDLRARVRGHAEALAAALDLETPRAAIVPVPVGDEARALRASDALLDGGFDVRAVRPPTVPTGTSRLRVVCHADHARADVEALARALRGVLGVARGAALEAR